mgnify:CR=1 FL=1
MADYSKMTPPEVWKLIRTGEITRPTAGMCAGYAQANLVILPKKYADDFKEFARKNPKPCPILEVVEGTPDIHDMGEGASIVTDIPKYFIYRDGVKVDEVTDVSSYWKEDSVAFLIGCSFSFEEALMKAGIEVRHIAQGCNVSMYKTNIQCESAGVFKGPMVVRSRSAIRQRSVSRIFPNQTMAIQSRSARVRSRYSGLAALPLRQRLKMQNFR